MVSGLAANARVSRTRHCVAFLAVCLAAAVGVLVGPVHSAQAISSCPLTGGQKFTGGGYWKTGTPAIGKTVNAHIQLVSADIFSGGVSSYLGITVGGNGVKDNLLVGIRDSGIYQTGTPELYFSADGTTYFHTPVSYSNSYHVWITHDAANQYSMHYSATSPKTIITYNDGSANQTDLLGSDLYAGIDENKFQGDFTGLVSPYNTSGMTACETSGGNGPYTVLPDGAPNFAVIGNKSPCTDDTCA